MAKLSDQERWQQMNAYGLERAEEFMTDNKWEFKPIEHEYFNFELLTPSGEVELLKVATRNHTNQDGSLRQEFMIFHSEKDGRKALEYAKEQGARAIWFLYVVNAPQQTFSHYEGSVSELDDKCRLIIKD